MPCDGTHACAGTTAGMARGQEQATGGEGRLPKPSSSRDVLSFFLCNINNSCLSQKNMKSLEENSSLTAYAVIKLLIKIFFKDLSVCLSRRSPIITDFEYFPASCSSRYESVG